MVPVSKLLQFEDGTVDASFQSGLVFITVFQIDCPSADCKFRLAGLEVVTFWRQYEWLDSGPVHTFDKDSTTREDLPFHSVCRPVPILHPVDNGDVPGTIQRWIARHG